MNEMYNIIKQVIESKDFKLSEITGRIEKRCFEGRITEEQRNELLTLANQNASAENEKASNDNQFEAIFKNLGEMALEIKAIKAEVARLKGEEVEEETPEQAEEYPAWERWNGIGDIPYQKDSKCTHNGVKYISQVDNNIWEPGAPGVYENIWKKVETE